MPNAEELIGVFARLRPSATFVSVKEYVNNYREMSNFGIVFHIDYAAALKRSYEIVSTYKAEGVLYKQDALFFLRCQKGLLHVRIL